MKQLPPHEYVPGHDRRRKRTRARIMCSDQVALDARLLFHLEQDPSGSRFGKAARRRVTPPSVQAAAPPATGRHQRGRSTGWSTSSSAMAVMGMGATGSAPLLSAPRNRCELRAALRPDRRCSSLPGALAWCAHIILGTCSRCPGRYAPGEGFSFILAASSQKGGASARRSRCCPQSTFPCGKAD